MAFLFEIIRLGVTNLRLHKLRSLLTALGIIIGVGAVVAIAAYGEGSKQKALASIRELGARNIIVRSVKPAEPNTPSSGQNVFRTLRYGLLRRDQRRIEETVGPIARLVPLKQVGSRYAHGRFQVPQAMAFGTTPDLLEVTSLRVERGRYLTDADMNHVDNVAVLGAKVAAQLFPLGDPIGDEIRIDGQAFKVVGLLREVGLAGGAGTALVGRDLNYDIHIPLTTAKGRFGDLIVTNRSGSRESSQIEISELYVQVPDDRNADRNVRSVAEQIVKVLDVEHAKSADATVYVPLELLDQAERTQLMFNVLMIIIAGLSLLVGGIGIMNIMLASVTERTREIGIRRALGATRRHVIAQFLVETTVLSGIGGVIGVGLGIGGALFLRFVHGYYPAIERPIVTLWSILVSFLVATTVGILFGLYPAMQAAKQDPIVALRHD
jgi:putative ABC transport system permease protein